MQGNRTPMTWRPDVRQAGRIALGITLSVALAGCGTPAAGPAAGPPTTATPSSSPTPSPTVTQSAVQGGYAVLIGGASAPSYSLRLIDVTGRVVATATATNRTSIRVGGPGDNAPAIVMPKVSSSDTRLYYINGNTEVRSLTVDGKSSVATHVPGSATVQAGFAVSPDDRRIAVATIDYAAHPPALRLYVENLAAGGSHLEIFSSTSSYVWPVGWHGSSLILAVGPAAAQYGTGNPYDAISGYHVADAATANRLAAICEPPARAVSLIARTGALCVSDSGAFQQLWDGSRHSLPANCSALSPSGNLAACGGAGSGLPTGAISIVNADGTRTSTGVAGFGPLGWIDDEHLIFAAGANSSSDMQLLDLASGVATPIGHDFEVVARFGGSGS
jgi:hypothetical protein